MVSPHALDRIAERAPDIAPVALAAIQRAERSYPRGHVAVRVAVLPAHRGDVAADYYSRTQSNGNEVWAVVREGYCVTVMLRRADQRREPQAFGVERVILAV